MEEIVEYLQKIQNNLVGIVIPAIITAGVSLFTLLLNSLITILQGAKKQNSEQFAYMQKVYPEFREMLQDLWVNAHGMKQSNELYKESISEALKNYYTCIRNEKQFRQDHASIDTFLDWTNKYLSSVEAIGGFLHKNEMPLGPALHPIVRSNVYSMLSTIQKDVFIVKRLKDHPEELEALTDQLDACRLDEKRVKEYIELTDKWFRAYR